MFFFKILTSKFRTGVLLLLQHISLIKILQLLSYAAISEVKGQTADFAEG